jgi:hypothetical protein
MRGAKWSEYETQLLYKLAEEGFNTNEMVSQIGRSYSSIRLRAEKLGVTINKRGRHYATPKGDRETWNTAQRICAFANVPLPLAEYVVAVAEFKNIRVSELRSDSREMELVRTRAIIAKRARENGYTLQAIGRALNRDHTTIIHAIRCIAA